MVGHVLSVLISHNFKMTKMWLTPCYSLLNFSSVIIEKDADSQFNIKNLSLNVFKNLCPDLELINGLMNEFMNETGVLFVNGISCDYEQQ